MSSPTTPCKEPLYTMIFASRAQLGKDNSSLWIILPFIISSQDFRKCKRQNELFCRKLNQQFVLDVASIDTVKLLETTTALPYGLMFSSESRHSLGTPDETLSLIVIIFAEIFLINSHSHSHSMFNVLR